MSSNTDWLRVNKSRRCLICGRADWCLIARDGSAAICARVESNKRAGEAGWLHKLSDDHHHRHHVRTVRTTAQKPSRPDLSILEAQFIAAATPARLNPLVAKLGVSVESLMRLGVGWSRADRAHSFPMVDHCGRIRGIRLRATDGSKWAVRGGRDGLFLPLGDPTEDRLLICEGVSDCAALLDLKFGNVVGRPSCSGGTRLIVELVRVRKPREAVIVADADTPGLRGANTLASVLVAYVPTVRVIQPPNGINDARAWLRAGATRRDVMNIIKAADVGRLKIRTIGIRA